MFKEIIVQTTEEGADFVSDAFFSLGASGVKIIDPNDIYEIMKSGIRWDYLDETLLDKKDEPVLVSAFVSDEKCQETIEMLKQELAIYKNVDLGSLDISIKHYQNDDWCEEWKKFFKPIEIDKIVVVPKWIDYQNPLNKTIITINPSMAFGTGEHESTRLMLMLMCTLNLNNKFVIDIGTGSGILGIAAIKLGAKKAYMCDIDSFAIESARQNILLNNVVIATELEQSDLISRDDLVGDVLLCNLTADILLTLSENLNKHIKKGSLIVCSGIILDRKQQVLDAYTALGLTLINDVTQGEWTALCFEYR